MEFSDWEPYYLQIVKEFGYSIDDDMRSAQLLGHLCEGKDICHPPCLQRHIGEEVTVLGHGPKLERTLRTVELKGTVITADGATSVIMHELGRVPDIIVTDLDGDVPDQIAANAQGAVAVVLAHGDNVEKVRRFIPWFTGPITPTTPAHPFDRVYNFGGFTDGDRAVVMARHFGAKKIHLLGFEYDSPRYKEGRDRTIKVNKLRCARKFIWDLNPPSVELLAPEI